MQLERALVGAIVTAQQTAHVPATVTEIAALFGEGRKGSSGLAAALAGTSDKSSLEYKAKLRNVERYLKAESGVPGQTRLPSAATLADLGRLAENKVSERTIDGMRRRGVTASFSGVVIVSPTGRKRDERDRDINNVYLDPEHVAEFLDAFERGDYAGAGDEFSAAFMDSYGIGGAVMGDTYDIGLTIGGGE